MLRRQYYTYVGCGSMMKGLILYLLFYFETCLSCCVLVCLPVFSLLCDYLICFTCILLLVYLSPAPATCLCLPHVPCLVGCCSWIGCFLPALFAACVFDLCCLWVWCLCLALLLPFRLTVTVGGCWALHVKPVTFRECWSNQWHI